MTGASTFKKIFLSRIAASASPLEGAIPGLSSSLLLNYVCFDVFIFFFLLFVLRVRFYNK